MNMNLKNTTVIFIVASLLLPLSSVNAAAIADYVQKSIQDNPLYAKCVSTFNNTSCYKWTGAIYDVCTAPNTLSEIIAGSGSTDCVPMRRKTYYCDAWCRTRPEGYTDGSCVPQDVMCPDNKGGLFGAQGGVCTRTNTSSATTAKTTYTFDTAKKPKKVKFRRGLLSAFLGWTVLASQQNNNS